MKNNKSNFSFWDFIIAVVDFLLEFLGVDL